MPKAIQILLPVWGRPFISQFLELSLPTLLAPGNLPSIAKSLPCKFIFLTSSEDAIELGDHPAIRYLRHYCEVETRTIDDLITGDNYSATITLSYARAIRTAGVAMLDTCFFFMISDYIMADGSLASVLARIQAGYSGVVAGNFQVTEEDAKESFFKTFDVGGPQIVIRSRDLMRWSIDRLHPMTLANMVNFPLCHSTHSNRLFWFVDENTLIGRFYLMHMISIRPEVTDFIVGSSCDYSFIPEMCPSGKVYPLTDSDEYLVVEMQKRDHERKFVRLGAVKQNRLAESLAEWATETHRKNAHSAVVFHAEGRPSNLDSIIAESEAYIETIERALPPPPPHRGHPYWLGAISGHAWAISQTQKGNAPLIVSETVEAGLVGFDAWLYRLGNFVYGRPPNVRPWHPRWPDYRMLLHVAQRHFTNTDGSLLIISNRPAAFASFLSGVSQSTVSFSPNRFLNLNYHQYTALVGTFEGCLLILREDQINRIHELVTRIKPLLVSNGTLVIFATNGYGADVRGWFTEDILQNLAQFFDHELLMDEVSYIRAGWVPWVTLRGLQNAFASIQRNWLWISVESLWVGFLTVVSFLANFARRRAAVPPSARDCSSIALALRKIAEGSCKVVEASSLNLAGRRFGNDQNLRRTEESVRP